MNVKLNPDFLIELLGGCLKNGNKDLLQVVCKELQVSYLPDETYKHVFTQIQDYYEVSKKIPTIAILSQHFDNNMKVMNLLNKLKKVVEVDKNSLLQQLEIFIKKREFHLTYDELGDIWNQKNFDKAYDLLIKTANKINGYSITQKSFTKVLHGFDNRQSRRKNLKEIRKKVPFYIDGLDEVTKGGMDRGDTYIYIGGSGSGKSTALRHTAKENALAGLNVVHFMAEDTEETTVNLYDSSLLGETLYDIENSEVSDIKIKNAKKIIDKAIFEKGEIYLKTFEQFNTATFAECRIFLQDLQREIGEIHLIVWDYLELFDPSDGIRYGAADSRQKREAIANKMKNIAMEFNAASLTATQSMDIKQALLEDPDFVMTRNHISEFKGLVKPFSGVITLNQTPDEYDNGEMRLFIDKMRKYKRGKVIKIAQAVEVGRFYSRKKTIAKGFYAEAA